MPGLTPPTRNLFGSFLEKHRSMVSNYRNQLERQHIDKPLITGNITLLAQFYFAAQQPIVVRENKPHHQKPDCLRLFEFLDRISLGILYDNRSAIIKFEGEKLYSLKPRTEIILIEEIKK